ncbi:MAG: hypothetical protein ABI072_00735 [Edaphobacter sp.]
MTGSRSKRTGKPKPEVPAKQQSSQANPKPVALYRKVLTCVAKPIVSIPGSLGLLIAYVALWPQLSINQDFSFDTKNAFNTSFSVVNEGILPLTDLSATCIGGFTMHSGEFSGDFGTTADYSGFAKELTFKHRVSLPCNHNVVANGHSLEPGATLAVRVRYRILGLPIPRPQTFNFKAIAGTDGRLYWQYNG